MARICAVCYQDCRGSCPSCGSGLCSRCKYKPCPICAQRSVSLGSGSPLASSPARSVTPSSTSSSRRNYRGRRSSFRPAIAPGGVPYYVPPSPTQSASSGTSPQKKALKDMTEAEALTHLQDVKMRLLKKQQRERAYLSRRAARGTHTPTDDVYEEDQILEDEIAAILDHLLSQNGP